MMTEDEMLDLLETVYTDPLDMKARRKLARALMKTDFTNYRRFRTMLADVVLALHAEGYIGIPKGGLQ